MKLTQIIDVLPAQVYLRRGEMVIHFSTPSDLITRLGETASLLSDIDRQSDVRTPGRRLGLRPAPAGKIEVSGDVEAKADE